MRSSAHGPSPGTALVILAAATRVSTHWFGEGAVVTLVVSTVPSVSLMLQVIVLQYSPLDKHVALQNTKVWTSQALQRACVYL